MSHHGLCSIGFIAGCSNTAFAASNIPWDLCCDIETGKVTLNEFIKSSSPYIVSGEGVDEADLVAHDLTFMTAVQTLVKSGSHDMIIRGRFYSYMKAFTRYSLFTNAKRMADDVSIVERAPVCTFVDDDEKRLATVFGHRVALWQNTWAYDQCHQQWRNKFRGRCEYLLAILKEMDGDEQQEETSRQLARIFDIDTLIAMFGAPLKLQYHQLLAVYQLLFLFSETDERMNELVAALILRHDGGVGPLCMGLLHNCNEVRYACMEFLDALRQHPAGSRLFASSAVLNPFFANALRRVSEELASFNTISPSAVSPEAQRTQWRIEMAGSQESLASHGSRPSYMSFTEPDHQSPAAPGGVLNHHLNNNGEQRQFLNRHAHLHLIPKLKGVLDPLSASKTLHDDTRKKQQQAQAQGGAKQSTFFRNFLPKAPISTQTNGNGNNNTSNGGGVIGTKGGFITPSTPTPSQSGVQRPERTAK